MATMVVSKINSGDAEGEDFDAVAFETSISSILNFLEPAARGLPRALDEDKYCTKPEAKDPDLHNMNNSRQGAEESLVVAPNAIIESARSSSPAQLDVQLAYIANKRASDESANIGTQIATAPAAIAEVKNVEADNGYHRIQQGMELQQPEDDVIQAGPLAKSPSCSSDGAGSTASALAPEVGHRVTDACKTKLRDMLREVLLKTLPLPEAADVLFKIDSHIGWHDLRTIITAIIGAALSATDFAATPGGGGSDGNGGNGAAPPPPFPRPYSGSSSVPCTPAQPSKSTPHVAGVGPLPPKLPPLPSCSPPYEMALPSGGASSAPSALAPLTPARSAPPGSLPQVSGYDSGGGIVGDAAAATASSGGSSPIGSGSGGCTENAGSRSLLVNIMSNHPLMEYLQAHPQLLSSVINMQEGFAPAPTPLSSGPAGLPMYDDAGSGNLAAVLRGLSPPPPPQPMSSPATSSIRSPPAMASPVTHGGASIWGSPLPPPHGSPVQAGLFGSPQPRSTGAPVSGLEAFHLLMGGGNGSAAVAATDAGGHAAGVAGAGIMLQGTDPSAEGYSCKAFGELLPAVQEKIQSVLDTCGPHIRSEHFDAGVRHWLMQLQGLFGELSAVSALHAIETAANLEGVRRMKAFITTRLIDHHEQMVWAQDPQGYAIRKLTADLIVVLQDLVHSDKGLKWTHFDPKVLDTIREIRSPDAVRTRLSKLCAQELNGVQNVPAYLYTLLSKRGKTAKQAAAQKQMQEFALRVAVSGGVGVLGLGGVGVSGATSGGLGGFGGLSGLGGFGSATSGAYGGVSYGGTYGSGFAGGSGAYGAGGLGGYGASGSAGYGASGFGGYGASGANGSGGYGASGLGGYGASGANGSGGYGASGLGGYGASNSAYGTGAGGGAFGAGYGGAGGYGAGGGAGGLGGLGGFGSMFGT